MRHPRPPLLVALLLTAACAAPQKETPKVFYPPPPAAPRLQLLASYTDAKDLESSDGFRKFVVGSEKERRIIRAHGLAWRDKKLYVCDPALPHVVVLDFEKERFRLLDPKRPTIFQKCIDISIAPDGWKYITDVVTKKVIVYDDKNQYRTAFGDPEKWRPVSVAATADRLYVTDAANHRVVTLDRKSGKELASFGKLGSPEGDFYYPISIRIGPEGDLYVSDSFNFRVQRLKKDGTFVRSFGQLGKRFGDFSRPRGIALDREGRLYAADAAFENVQVFGPDGRLLIFFGGPGGDPGNMSLPAAIAVSYDAVETFKDRVGKGHELECVIFVSNQAGLHKVNVYGLLRAPAPE